jgi:acyl CoA:acetate/3-ketoacid CoA transferase
MLESKDEMLQMAMLNLAQASHPHGGEFLMMVERTTDFGGVWEYDGKCESCGIRVTFTMNRGDLGEQLLTSVVWTRPSVL